MHDKRRRIKLLAGISAAAILTGGGILTATSAHAAVACSVTYTVSASWPGGFTANVDLRNVGDPLNGWSLRWSFTAGQTVTQMWNATPSQSGSQVTATNVSYNGSVATNTTVSFGFNGTWNNSSNPVPTSFALNGTTCTGSAPPPPPPTTGPPPPTTPPPTTPPPPPPTTGPPPPPQTGLIGWATQGGGTTGGGSGPTVTVTSLAALTSAAGSTTAQTIRINGNFSCSADVRVASNKTILGVGSSSGLTGCGFNLRDVSNIIIRNLRISFVQAGNGNGDAIHIDHATRIWIDHNELFSNTTSGTDFYDGLLDCTHACDFVTVSWNYFHDHIKCSLVGHSDSNAAEDTGHLRMTYHHNRFSNCSSRNPRVRFGNPVHVFNNYYVNIGDYGVASTESAGVLVENNYFENTADPFHLGEGSSDPGSIVARNNFFTGSGTGQAGGSVAGIPYSYTLEAASNVRTSVINGAGTGKIAT